MEDIGGSADKEAEEIVVTDVVDSTVDVGKEKVVKLKRLLLTEKSPACG